MRDLRAPLILIHHCIVGLGDRRRAASPLAVAKFLVASPLLAWMVDAFGCALPIPKLKQKLVLHYVIVYNNYI